MEVHASSSPADRNLGVSKSAHEFVSVSAVKIFVGCIPADVTEDRLRYEFAQFGELTSVFYMPDLDDSSNGWAFATYSNREAGVAAVESIDGTAYFETRSPDVEELGPTPSQGSQTLCKAQIITQRRSSDCLKESLPSQIGPVTVAENWQQFTTSDGIPYYYNVRTGQTQWNSPQEVERPTPKQVVGNLGFGPPGSNLFVFHLPSEWEDEDFYNHFQRFGVVVSARVQRDPDGRNRGFGFISYDNPHSALNAIKHMNGYYVCGKYLKVQLKKGDKQHVSHTHIVPFGQIPARSASPVAKSSPHHHRFVTSLPVPWARSTPSGLEVHAAIGAVEAVSKLAAPFLLRITEESVKCAIQLQYNAKRQLHAIKYTSFVGLPKHPALYNTNRPRSTTVRSDGASTRLHEPLAQLPRQCAQADGRQEVDGEPQILRVVPGENPRQVRRQLGVVQLLAQLPQTQRVAQLLQNDLHEYAPTRGGARLAEHDDRQHRPGHRVRRQHVREELGHVPQLCGLQPVHQLVLLGKALLEVVRVHHAQLRKALCLQGVEGLERALHRTAVDQHRADFHFAAGGQVQLQQLVHALLVVERGHDAQIHRLPQVDQVLAGGVADDRGGTADGRSRTRLFGAVRLAITQLSFPPFGF
ncbi:RNA-binding protein, putative [Babesia caballi]|uniref:RNA-binding protein, putative n=1 Tax=Babesia caballi TaxID=5871 RepID=A0AAV4M199_BABCB|nr:RNA-binding protein, putative [Babesia caballi]